jgi:hypothetical protein
LVLLRGVALLAALRQRLLLLLRDYFCYQAAVIVLVFKQVEAKLILAYNFGFCVLLSVLIGKDLRLLLVWSALFPGICLVTFSDAVSSAQSDARFALLCSVHS